jgi:hypothetical protein
MRCVVALILLAGIGCNNNISGASGGAGGASGAGAGSGGSGAGSGGDNGDASGCPDVHVTVSKVIPTVELLLDQSGSMTDSFGSTTRWNAMYSTLMASPNGVVMTLQGDVRFGLALYTSHNGGPSCPEITRVPIALNNYSAIDAVFQPAAPQQDTPTGESIEAVIPDLQAVSAPGPKIIVLATDGEPDTCAVPNPQTGQARAIQGAQTAFRAGIDTYIISVGPETSDQHLQDMANAGVGNPVGGSMNAPFYRALDPQQLIGAFNQIIGGARTCRFTLSGRVDPNLASQGHVIVDGQVRSYGTDWRLVDDHTIELLGGLCDSIKSGTHQVDATFPCGAIIG